MPNIIQDWKVVRGMPIADGGYMPFGFPILKMKIEGGYTLMWSNSAKQVSRNPGKYVIEMHQERIVEHTYTVKGVKYTDHIEMRKNPPKPQIIKAWRTEYLTVNKYRDELIRRFGEDFTFTILGQLMVHDTYAIYYN